MNCHGYCAHCWRFIGDRDRVGHQHRQRGRMLPVELCLCSDCGPLYDALPPSHGASLFAGVGR